MSVVPVFGILSAIVLPWLQVVRKATENTIYRGYVWDSVQDSVKMALLQVHNFVDNSGRKK
ncbi:hypothetical protein CXP54_11870 [Escherichia albertii]|uniref:Uncharacterized protein n=1 Tax=Escherichia albertii TaxID=208962 RepID=A0ABX5HHM2_ESCAL|nr:hypothetical protein CXP54_11870 [Escherichia albertii]EAB1452289.1 hypothetical protein [Escherichia albertii]EEW3328974.1 hypothetical protein [Escherichia albertii]EEW4356996.1 hypothetical protein [Escherichia albertii]EEW7340012.1 hypothetical protein [Escherichia albertii]